MHSVGSSFEQIFLRLKQALDLAVKHHSTGNLSEAEDIYQQILQANPNQPDALHLLGVIAHQKGGNDRAVDLINKALAIKPDYPEACSNLGAALKDLGRFDELNNEFILGSLFLVPFMGCFLAYAHHVRHISR